MSYSSFLIANYATGLDRELQPWLLPNDAFTDLEDGYVYRGVTYKRDGYSGYAIGEDSTYCESRMVVAVSAAAVFSGVIDGANKTFVWHSTPPLRRGTYVVNGSNPVQVLTDDGVGGFTGNGTGTIDYTTGVVSITFTTAPVALSTVTSTYAYHPGLPVMGIMSYYPKNNIRQMVVADTRNVNYYDPATDRLLWAAHTGTYAGTNENFWSWTNYAAANSDPRLLFCNGVTGDVIQQWTGASPVVNYAPTFAVGTLNAVQIFNYKDRLVLFSTIENNVRFPKRIRISGFGTNCDVFDVTVPGAGFIDIPDNTNIFGAAFNRDDLLFFSEASTWSLKYTGNDVTPFLLQKIDGSRGCTAAFSAISYLNRTMAASPRGLIMVDGYQVERMDDNIPLFTINQINNQYFNRCFSAFLDEDRDVYMTYPSQDRVKAALVPVDGSDDILVTNFEEDNFCIYNIPLSCMGNFQETIAKQWQDLTAANGFANWNDLAAKYNNWNAFPFSIGTPLSIGGGHKGEIWEMNATEGQDNPQMIRAITIINGNTIPQQISVTTDWNNYEVGDYIYFSGVEGMTEINNKQGEVIDTTTDYTTIKVEFGEYVGNLSAYTTGGTASKSFEFSAISKKLNPWVESDKKVRCGWMYFYVSVAETPLTKYNNGVQDEVPATLIVEVMTSNNDYPNATKPYYPYFSPQFTYEVNCTNLPGYTAGKKWVKIWINQVGQFLQFRMSNRQAGAAIQVHAMMAGLQPVGRLI